jgi:flavorubredoxin
MTTITEIAADVFRIATYVPEADLLFAQFLVRDEQPLLYHTGMRGLFPIVRDAVAKVLDPSTIRWIGFSHFEADECGSLREWQELAPQSTAICSLVGKIVSVDDVLAVRPAQAMEDDEVLTTGKYRFRFLRTPHLPHCWEASLLFEETQRTLFCSDLLHQGGDVEPVTSADVTERVHRTLTEYELGPLAGYLPWTDASPRMLARLADLEPRTIAVMHGSSVAGDGGRAIREAAKVMQSVLGTPR